MDNEKRKLYHSVKELLENNRFRTMLNVLLNEADVEDKEEKPIFEHTFSRDSFSKFEERLRSKMMDDIMNFHRHLKQVMIDKKVSQATLSKLSDIKESTLSRYMNGSRQRIDRDNLFRIMIALKLTKKEAELLLRKNGMGFKESEKDAVVIEALEQRIYDVHKVEAVLRKLTGVTVK